MVRINSRFGMAAVVILAVPALSACGYNTIPTKQERAQAAWADVQSQYQRRADLIPNLVATVQGAAIQERTTLTQVTEARARATAVQVTPETLSDPAAFQQFQAAQGQLTSALSRLLVTVEAYPQLQANQGFLQLQSQLEGTENRITIARRDYNEAVRDYNISLRTFPTVIWARTVFSGEEPMQLFTATAEAQSAPQVQFNLNGAPTNAPGSTPPAR
ncbi:LemA family protein [Brevundimonas sp. AJA228-03]|uniref:LemA family protein n=1 Tax=Brevundimonas sp. AJA228-03 TaxID=2752515 RepID=UPI001ADFD1E6|nr:LemA family protein [Brevundimonas sp. AJA228-03]QTN18754.1 LemA family protein [Brevundimonas sp. AJA228-03]